MSFFSILFPLIALCEFFIIILLNTLLYDEVLYFRFVIFRVNGDKDLGVFDDVTYLILIRLVLRFRFGILLMLTNIYFRSAPTISYILPQVPAFPYLFPPQQPANTL